MGATIFKNLVVFGNVPEKPLRGFPPGETEVRIHPKDFVRVVVKNRNGTREFVPHDAGDFWEPCLEVDPSV